MSTESPVGIILDSIIKRKLLIIICTICISALAFVITKKSNPAYTLELGASVEYYYRHQIILDTLDDDQFIHSYLADESVRKYIPNSTIFRSRVRSYALLGGRNIVISFSHPDKDSLEIIQKTLIKSLDDYLRSYDTADARKVIDRFYSNEGISLSEKEKNAIEDRLAIYKLRLFEAKTLEFYMIKPTKAKITSRPAKRSRLALLMGVMAGLFLGLCLAIILELRSREIAKG